MKVTSITFLALFIPSKYLFTEELGGYLSAYHAISKGFKVKCLTHQFF